MSTAPAEARDLVELIAGPMRLGENVKAALARVARMTGIGHRRVRAIWNGEARRIEAQEMDRLRQVALDARTLKDASLAYRTHIARLQAARSALRVHAEDSSGSVDHGVLGVACGADCPVDRGAAA